MSQVVIDDIIPRAQFTATASQTVFNGTFTADATTDINVYARSSSAEPDDVTDLVNPSAYVVTFVGGSQTVRVTFNSGRTAGDIITIVRNTPAERENLYTNTNFTASMLNQDFGILTLIDQQAQMYDTVVTPHYNVSATIAAEDKILPILDANETWVKNPGNTEIISYTLPASGIAPAEDTYVLLTPDSSLPNSLPLSTIGTGFLINKPGSSTVSNATIAGTTHQITVTGGTGTSGTTTISIPANPILSGTDGMGIPTGTTAQRPVAPFDGEMRYNTDIHSLEYYDSGDTSWIDFSETGVLPGITNDLAYYASNGNQVSALATANNGVLFTSGAGVPSIGTAPIVAGGTGVTSVTTAPTASSWAGWDANSNLSTNNLITGYATTATAAGTTTLTVASKYQQYFTGSTTQTVVLPVTSTLVLGQAFLIVNNSSGAVTVQSSGANTIQAMAAATSMIVTCILTSGTTAASWNVDYYQPTSIALPLSLANGGTNASLTASANGLVYSTASALALLATGNSGTLITSAGGVPSISSTLPSAVQTNITALGVQAQALDMGSHLISNVTDPVSAQDAATKSYVDQTSLNGTSVYAASAATLGTVLQVGAGVGATLTNAGVQATFALDGVNPPVGTNVLIKNTATGMTAANEGIYIVTSVGSAITNWILTRATDYDTATEINNTGLILIQNGSTLSGTAWYNAATIVTVDTTSFSYSEFGNIVFPITLSHGGTNAALTASNGGIFYSTASAGAILSGTATANQLLMSGASTTPAWSTSTWPATTTVNQFLYSSSTNTVAGLATANGGVAVTSNAGVPSVLAGSGTSGTVLQAVASGTPAWSTSTFPTTATGTGTLLRADGTNWVATTSTYPNTNAVNTLLYASSANVMAALATANSSVLITSAGGVPSLSTALPASLTATSMNLTTPTIGVASATSINFGGGALGTYVPRTSWTPTISFATAGNLNVVYGNRNGYYVQIGDLITATCYVSTSTFTFTTASGNFIITGWPVAAGTQTNEIWVSAIELSGFTTTKTSYNTQFVNGGTTTCYLIGVASATGDAVFTTANFTSGTNITILFSISYFVS